MTPRYELLDKVFIAPYLLQKGSVIETHNPPGAAYKPLNAAATARMEEYYNRKVEVKDVDGKVVRVVYPNADKRPAPENGPDVEVHSVTLISGPPVDDPNVPTISLAEAQIRKGTPGDLNPTGTSKPEPSLSLDESVAVVTAAAPPKKV